MYGDGIEESGHGLRVRNLAALITLEPCSQMHLLHVSHQVILPGSSKLTGLTIILRVQVYSVNMHLQGSLCCDRHIAFVTSKHSSLVHQSLVIVQIPLCVELILTDVTHELGVAVSRLNVPF